MAIAESEREIYRGDDLQSRAERAREELDAWTREVVRWHFDPATGCPFWLDFAKKLDWDPREEIGGFADLERFGGFEDEWLRGGPVRRWVPRAYADRPVYVFETGGSTGIPKSRINIDDFRIDYSMFSRTLSDEGFPPGSNWLMLGPSGPRRLRLAVEHLAQVRGGICFCVDLDPRWVVRLIKKQQFDVLEDYKAHVIQQALTLLRAHDDIHAMFTTPKLLEALCERISLRKAGIRGVFCGGTEMTRQFHRFAREELLEGAEFVPTYGNTLMGLACHKPFDPADDYMVIYHAPQARAVLQIVDPDRPERLVPYGERGRVKLTTLTKEFFMPGFLERDEAIRTPPIGLYPWDGVGDVRPFRKLDVDVVEGVY
jgi:phenylacetate-coenzyme A ligase PaaK-like adenylate-forming protein